MAVIITVTKKDGTTTEKKVGADGKEIVTGGNTK